MEPELGGGEMVHGGQRRAAPSFEIRIGAATSSTHAPGQDVGLDLPVPLLRQKLLKPLRKAIKLVSRELGNGGS